MKGSDIGKLVLAVVILAAVAAAAFFWVKSEGNKQQKYSHPISRPGAGW